MAVRIRKDLTILCAAKSEEQEGDIYVNDGLHYVLSVELKVLHPIARNSDGAEIWVFDTSGSSLLVLLRNLIERQV